MSGTTSIVGVIGWPVEGSLSPAIHNAAFAALSLDWVYVPLPVSPHELRDALAGLEALGFSGANVTMPHKTETAELIGNLSEDSERLQAVNTVVITADGVKGHNTDAPGFDRFLRRDADYDPAGKTALVYGAGGAARACALALARAGIGEVAIAAREPARADGVRRALEGLGTSLRILRFEDAVRESPSLVVNATPLGEDGQSLPLPPISSDVLVVDLLYRPAITPLLDAANAAGARAFGGLGLLLHQAALSFELWTGLEAPAEAMSAAVGAAGRAF